MATVKSIKKSIEVLETRATAAQVQIDKHTENLNKINAKKAELQGVLKEKADKLRAAAAELEGIEDFEDTDAETVCDTEGEEDEDLDGELFEGDPDTEEESDGSVED